MTREIRAAGGASARASGRPLYKRRTALLPFWCDSRSDGARDYLVDAGQQHSSEPDWRLALMRTGTAGCGSGHYFKRAALRIASVSASPSGVPIRKGWIPMTASPSRTPDRRASRWPAPARNRATPSLGVRLHAREVLTSNVLRRSSAAGALPMSLMISRRFIPFTSSASGPCFHA